MASRASKRFFRAAPSGTSATALHTAFWCGLTAVSLAVNVGAAPKRCDWHGPLSGGEKPYAKCVDFAALQGKSLDLPKNVTRISADGLSFCQTATPTTGAGEADIVFVYDNSGSMTADAVYINPITKDTAFHYMVYDRGNTCHNNIVKPIQTVSYPSREGGNWDVFALSGTSGCENNLAGDPYNARAP